MAKLLKEDRVGGEQQIFLVNNEIELGNFFRRKTLLDDNSQIFLGLRKKQGEEEKLFIWLLCLA